MKELRTKVNNEEYERILAYCKKHEISIWALVKGSVLRRVGLKYKPKNMGKGVM